MDATSLGLSEKLNGIALASRGCRILVSIANAGLNCVVGDVAGS